MTDRPPYVETVERLAQRIASAKSTAALEALWKDATFRADYDALPERGKNEVARIGRDHRNAFAIGAG